MQPAPIADPSLRTTYETGVMLANDIVAHVKKWPVDGGGVVRPEMKPHPDQEVADQLHDRTYAWFNSVSTNILPYTAYPNDDLYFLLRRCVSAIRGKCFVKEHRYGLLNALGGGERVSYNVEIYEIRGTLISDTEQALAEALRIVRTAATAPNPFSTASNVTPRSSHIPNTAFILMWMDKAHPELVDVHEAVKEVFCEFGITACRADEVQHQDRITDVVLRHIQETEFLFADVTGERPNVYYEIGYAHALGKRPILYRRSDTPLHFDLSIHNVPEYANVTELRRMLRERLSSITGRTPSASHG